MTTKDFQKLALIEHKKLRGKIAAKSKVKLQTEDQLSTFYTPGVGAVSSLLANEPKQASAYTIKSDMVAVISDGSAVLGLGNIGPNGALPVLEGKAMLFAELAGLNAFPIALNTQDPEEIITTVKNIAPNFAAINLEDIKAPECFAIERRLQKELDIPVVHDDQHATAVVVLAGLINALQVVGKNAKKAKVVILGAGAAGTGVAKLLIEYGFLDVIVLDSKGVISVKRPDLNIEKAEIAKITNLQNLEGGISEAIANSDIFIGLTTGGSLEARLISTMNSKPIIFALANPNPEILPSDAIQAGAAVVATGRSDFPNQINNVLVFPGMFKGLIDHKLVKVTDQIKLNAAEALARVVIKPTNQHIIPSALDKKVVEAIAANIT